MYPITFFASIWIARYLGAEGKGVYSYILVITSFFIPIFSLGIGGGFTYYISNKEFNPQEVGFSTLCVGIFIGFINTVLLYLFWRVGFLGEMNDKLTQNQILLLGIVLISNSIFFFLSRLAKGASRFHLLNLLDILKVIMNPIIMITLIYILALRIDGVIYGLVILNVSLALIICIRFFKIYPQLYNINVKFIKKSFKYGIKGWLGDMSVKANVRLDQIILGGVVSATSLGFYSVGVVLAEMLWIIPDSIVPVLFNRIAAEKDLNAKIALTEQIHRLLFSLSFFIALLWVCLCIFIIIPYGYGSEYNESVIPFLILAPGALLYIPAKVTTKLLSGSGRILDTSKATAFGSLISIVLYFILIPIFHIKGAAIASSIGYFSVSLFCIYYTKKHFNLSIRKMLILTNDDLIWIKNQYTGVVTALIKKLKN